MNKSSNFKTYHELGTFFIELGEQLKDSLDEEFEYVIKIKKINKTIKVSDYEDSENLKTLALQIINMERDETEKQLVTLKSKELTKLCKILSISTSGKKKKEDVIKRILFSLFDTMEGHRLIRNFGKNSN